MPQTLIFFFTSLIKKRGRRRGGGAARVYNYHKKRNRRIKKKKKNAKIFSPVFKENNTPYSKEMIYTPVCVEVVAGSAG